MYTECTLATKGPDDAESLAQTLELIAQQLRGAGGNVVTATGENVVGHHHGSQHVYYSVVTTND